MRLIYTTYKMDLLWFYIKGRLCLENKEAFIHNGWGGGCLGFGDPVKGLLFHYVL